MPYRREQECDLDHTSVGALPMARGLSVFHMSRQSIRLSRYAKTRPLLEIIAKYTNLPLEQVVGNCAYIDPDGKLDVKNVDNQIKWLQHQGFVDKVDESVAGDPATNRLRIGWRRSHCLGCILCRSGLDVRSAALALATESRKGKLRFLQ